MSDICKVITGCPPEIEPPVPSEEIEFPLAAARTFVTFRNMVEDIAPGDDNTFHAPAITADMFKILRDVCSQSFYAEFTEYFEAVWKKANTEKKEFSKLLCKEDSVTYDKMVATGSEYLSKMANWENDKNNWVVFETVHSGNNLEAQFVFDIAAKLIAKVLNENTPEEVRRIFNLNVSDITVEDIRYAIEYIRKTQGENANIPPNVEEDILASIHKTKI
jgi:DNA-directed RNA polymerase subunit F